MTKKKPPTPPTPTPTPTAATNMSQTLLHLIDDANNTVQESLVHLMYTGKPQQRKENHAAVLDALRTIHTRDDTSTKFQNKFLRKLFTACIRDMERIVQNEEYLPLECDDDEEEEEEEDEFLTERETEDLSIASALCFIKACAHMLQAYLDGLLSCHRNSESEDGADRHSKGHRHVTKRSNKVLDEALCLAELLHDLLFDLSSTYGNLKDDCDRTENQGANDILGYEAQLAIRNLCEYWWKHNFHGRDLLVTSLLPLLLVKSLDGAAQSADVRRMYDMRDALHLLDFEDEESIGYLKSLLCRTVSSPWYLRDANGPGRKFIIFLLSGLGQEELTLDLHRAIRAQIPNNKVNVIKVCYNLNVAISSSKNII